INNTSITELMGALCDSSLSRVSWKRRALGGVSREGFRRAFKKCAYGVLLSKIFLSGTNGSVPRPTATANTPPRNKVLMISFDLRVAGCREEAERLEEQLERLQEGASSGLKEVDAVLDLLVHLAGSAPPPPASFSMDYMRRERPVLRRPEPWGYQSEELQRLEAQAWGLVCGQEWGSLEGMYLTQRMMDAPPGTGLLGLKTKLEAEERFERDTRLSLFGALQHTRTSDIDIRLDLPPVPSNIDVTGLAIKVPSNLDQSEDEGFQSASNLTPDSQSEPSPLPDVDIWEALRTFEPGKRRCWESVGCPPGKRESLYLTEGGREAFDHLYHLWETQIRVVSTSTPSPLIPLPLDSQAQLVSDLLNVLIGVASTTFPLNQSVQFDVRPGVCVSGASPESMSRLLVELAQYGTHYLRLSHFSLQSTDKKGLVFQAFTGGLRKYLHYYRACVLSTPPTLSLLTIGFLFRKVGRQLRYLSELCCVDGPVGAGHAAFPVGVKLLSYLYNEAQNNCSNENYPVLLSLLKTSCEPYTRFMSDWVYSGVFRDVYGEFMIQVNEEYLGFRDKHFWVQGYTLISKDVEDCVPIFLRHFANDVYVCGKNINLLKICCPQHYICSSELPAPRIGVTFSLQEVEEIEKECAVYRGRLERIAKHSATSREKQVLRHFHCPHLRVRLRRTVSSQLFFIPAGRQVSQRLAEQARKRELFEEMKQQLEHQQEVEQVIIHAFPANYSVLISAQSFVFSNCRKELIAQYSRLTEEAAHRERRAMWRVQRLRLDEARARFFKRDGLQIQEVSSDLPDMRLGGRDTDYDFSAPFSPLVAPQSCPVVHKQFSDALVQLGSDPTTPLPSPLPSGHVDGHVKVGENVPEVVAHPLEPSVRSHASDAHIRVGENMSDVVASLPSPSIYGHSSDSHIRVGENMSDVVALLPSPSIYGHSSDSHIRVGENMSDVVALLPSPSIYGHSSDSHIRVGENVSDVVASLPSASIYGHSSDSHIRVGENVSDVDAPLPSPSIFGHSSDANIKVGEFVSNAPEERPRWSRYGHASDCTLQTGCVVSGPETTLSPLPGGSYGHSSDSALGAGCIVSEHDLQRRPLPGSAYGHSSDSDLAGGCVVSKPEPLPSPCLAPTLGSQSGGPRERLLETEGLGAAGCALSSRDNSEQEYLLALSAHYEVEHYEDSSSPECQLLKRVTRAPWGLPMDPTLRRATDTTAVQLSEMVSLPVLIKHSVTAPLITHVSLVNKAVVDYFFVDLRVERHFEALRHFLLMEDGEFAQSLSDLLFEKLASGQTPGELLTPLVLNSILHKALQYSLHGDTHLASNFTFALRFLPETFHPHAPDSLNCLELRYKVDWPLNIIITDSCTNKYNRLFSFLLQLKHMVWSLREVWFHLKRTALVKGAGRSVQFRQLQLYRHEMQHFVKVIQGYIANQILQVSWSEFTAKLATASDLDAIHRTHADYLNRAIFRSLLTEKAAPVMNIIHSIFSLILKFRAQLIAQPWDSQQGEAVHPSFVAMQQSYNTFKYYSHFLFKVVTKLVNRGYQPHLEDFLLRINFNNYYKDS
uniref:Gamma-tubulin complex component 6 n=1 Tax=Takifugu rubripes TaxID=31033 RepID=A0A674MTM9_TAKRU